MLSNDSLNKLYNCYFETDEYGRTIVANEELYALINGAQSDHFFSDSNSTCHDNAACGNAECGNLGC